jgi:hypothetical protein
MDALKAQLQLRRRAGLAAFAPGLGLHAEQVGGETSSAPASCSISASDGLTARRS